MYTTYFLIGFVTSLGGWSAGMVQKTVANTAVDGGVEVKQNKNTTGGQRPPSVVE